MDKIVLLVEDNDSVARSLIRLLRRVTGIQIIRVSDAFTAVEVLRDGTVGGKQITFVVTDWEFPLREGGEISPDAGKVVYGEAEKQGYPVAVLSGRGRPEPGFQWFSKPDLQGLNQWMESVS